MNNQSYKIFSFDVFDTVLTRNTATPHGIFHLIQKIIQKQLTENQNLLNQNIVDNFVELRINAENIARKNSSHEEINLYEIYTIINSWFSLSHQDRNFLISLEIQQELNSVQGVPVILNKLACLRKEEAKIIFISDTYLPQSIVRKMLIKVGAYQHQDKLYTSSKFLLTKESGKLFKYVLKKENIFSENIVHTGDNLISDIQQAKHQSIETIYFLDTQLNRYEKLLLGNVNNHSNIYFQLASGTSRLARLYSHGLKSSHTLTDIGSSIASPILVGYVLWILREAQRIGLKRLYFVARDGQILLDIARDIASKLNMFIDLRYLYGSRQAWHLPAMIEFGERELEWLLEADPEISLYIIGYRLGIDSNIIQNEIEKTTGEKWDIYHNFQPQELEKIRVAILCSEIKTMALNKAIELRKITIEYFKQEGLLEEILWGIVDLGWRGRLQKSLYKILATEKKGIQFYGLYFGLCEINNKNYQKTFFFSHDNIDKYWKIGNQFANFMEIFTAANHGTTQSYILNDQGILSPLLKERYNSKVIEWGLNDFRVGVSNFLRFSSVDVLKEIENNLSDYKNNILLIMETFFSNPSINEAITIGNHPFTSDQSETNIRKFAPQFSVIDSIKYEMIKNRGIQIKMTYWIDGTYERSFWLPRLILKSLQHFKIILKYLKMVLKKVLRLKTRSVT